MGVGGGGAATGSGAGGSGGGASSGAAARRATGSGSDRTGTATGATDRCTEANESSGPADLGTDEDNGTTGSPTDDATGGVGDSEAMPTDRCAGADCPTGGTAATSSRAETSVRCTDDGTIGMAAGPSVNGPAPVSTDGRAAGTSTDRTGIGAAPDISDR